jgi:uncharacterized membrane protein YhaH (DUF805 family)
MISALPKSDKPSSRIWSVLAFMLVLQVVLNLENGFRAHEMWRFVIYAAMSPLVAWIWIGHTMKCLRDLCLSRWWVLLNLLLVALAVWFDLERWLIASGVSLALALAIQLVIAIMKPSKNSGPGDLALSEGPPA